MLMLATFRPAAEQRAWTKMMGLKEEPLWDDEIEQMQHVARMAAMAQEVEALKALAGATQPTAAMTSASARLLASTNDEASSDADGLWEEEREAQQLLHEMAAWDEQVSELRQVAERDPRYKGLRSDDDDARMISASDS